MATRTLAPDQAAELDRIKRAVDASLEEVPSALVLGVLCLLAGRVSALAQYDGNPRPALNELIKGNLLTGEDQGRAIVGDHLKGRTN